MSYGGGLPYESTPPPESGPSLLDKPIEDDPLDQPLDDFKAPKAIPSHVSELMGRMSQGKLYLLEESPGIVYLDREEKIARDPRIRALASQLNEHDPTEWIDAVSAGAPSPIRHNALFVRSDLVKHLSTSKLFAWATSLGAGVMGIEWLNDTALHLVFPSSASALLGLSLLAKAGFDPAEGDDPLLERSAHSIPLSLLPQKQLPVEEQQRGTELINVKSSEGGEGVRRKGRGAFTSGETSALASSRSADASEADGSLPAVSEWDLADGVDPNARIAVRFGVEADKEMRRKKGEQSEWYSKHGHRAGKEVAARRANRYEEEAGDVSWDSGAVETNGEGKEFAKRIGRRPPRAREQQDLGRDRRPKRTEEDLDLELERLARRRQKEENGEALGEDDKMDVDEDLSVREARESRRYGERNGRGGRRERRTQEDLDKELDDMFATRPTDP